MIVVVAAALDGRELNAVKANQAFVCSDVDVSVARLNNVRRRRAGETAKRVPCSAHIIVKK